MIHHRTNRNKIGRLKLLPPVAATTSSYIKAESPQGSSRRSSELKYPNMVRSYLCNTKYGHHYRGTWSVNHYCKSFLSCVRVRHLIGFTDNHSEWKVSCETFLIVLNGLSALRILRRKLRRSFVSDPLGSMLTISVYPNQESVWPCRTSQTITVQLLIWSFWTAVEQWNANIMSKMNRFPLSSAFIKVT